MNCKKKIKFQFNYVHTFNLPLCGKRDRVDINIRDTRKHSFIPDMFDYNHLRVAYYPSIGCLASNVHLQRVNF